LAITMQGPWAVTVKSKSAAWQQRFVITGSSNSKDGAYEYSGSTAPPPVDIDGEQWTVAVEHRSANDRPWAQSSERIGSPNLSGSSLEVEIRSNDAGSDEDYNDLVLECTTVMSAFDHVVYGTVKSYPGLCAYNPCWTFGPYLVLETTHQLRRALDDGAMAAIVRQLYPDRVRGFERADAESEFSDDEAFRPMMIPMASRDASVIERAASNRTLGSAVDISYGDASKYKDLLKSSCTVRREAEQLLRFLEYDRTASELTGEPYTGDGDRQTLGLTMTDNLGNYIFRFTRSLADVSAEFADQVVGGPPQTTQLLPDVIVQLIQASTTEDDVLYETALYSNIPNTRRINLCFRDPGTRPATCGTGRVIERIGDVWVLPGIPNTFDSAGRITVTDGRAGFSIERAAWTGSLNVWGCFSEDSSNPVKWYTIRYRRWSVAESSWNDWGFVGEPEHRTNKNGLSLPWAHPIHSIGPNTRELKVDGTTTAVPAYDNIETNTDWAASDRHLKLKMNSLIYAQANNPGTLQFRIEGYDSAGDPVPDALDNLVLYIDNGPADGAIESISLGGFAPGECGLFDLSTPTAALTVRFNADQPGGHLQKYEVKVWRGSSYSLNVTGTVPLLKSYETSMGASFRGTLNIPGNTLGTLETNVVPTPAEGGWLPPGKTFCAFAFELWTTRRATNGRSKATARREHIELIGITHSPPP